jgi:hypothetical protein
MEKIPSTLPLGYVTRTLKMKPAQLYLITLLLFLVSELEGKDASLMGKNEKLSHITSNLRKPDFI